MNSINKNLVVIIMAGGVGTRFWPLSTHMRPKQFIQLFDDRSLLQKSYDRVRGFVPNERVIVLTNRQFTPLVREQFPHIPEHNIIGEPERKDTAATVCLGMLIAKKRFGNPIIVILTSDHLIEPIDRFQQALLSATKRADDTGAPYTFGIKPTHAATGYGYLEVGKNVAGEDGIEHFKIVSFKEKPNSLLASQYLKSGRYLWNSGMFVCSADVLYKEFMLNIPKHLRHLTKAVEKMDTDKWEYELEKQFAFLDKISIDYAVMERAQDIRCVATDFSWKDVGGWLAIQDFIAHDDNANYFRGKVYSLDATRNLVFCDQAQETLALVGISDIVVVRAGEKTLVAHKNRLEALKQVVESMLNQNESVSVSEIKNGT